MKLKFYAPHTIKRFERNITTPQLLPLPGMQPKGDCLVWTGSRNEKGYGKFWFSKPDGVTAKFRYTHRFALEVKLSRFITQDEHACHRCDCPACVNPDHLFLGTNRDNVDDKLAKGRNPSDLTEGEVKAIMHLLAVGESGKSIARTFGMDPVSISDIKLGRSWRHMAGVDGNPTHEQMQKVKPKSDFVAKLDEEQATEVKLRLASGEAPKAIAKSMGVSPGAIYHIKQGRTWSEIDIGVDLMALPLQPRGSRRP